MIKSGQFIREIEAIGWYRVGQEGSHIRFKHPDRDYSIFVPKHGARDMKTGLYYKLKKQAGLK